MINCSSLNKIRKLSLFHFLFLRERTQLFACVIVKSKLTSVFLLSECRSIDGKIVKTDVIYYINL